jgi:hypothetical protein
MMIEVLGFVAHQCGNTTAGAGIHGFLPVPAAVI